MESLKPFWQACERLAAAAVLKEWELSIKDSKIFTIARCMLVPTDRYSTAYPCTKQHPCGCTHELWGHKDGSKVAVCTCDEQECDRIPVTDEDLVIYQLNFTHIFRSLGKVIGFNPVICEVPGLPGVRSVGECSPSPGYTMPFYFAFHAGYGGMVEVIRQLSYRWSGPFVLFTLTALGFDLKAREASDRMGLLVIHLEDLIFAKDDGELDIDMRVKNTVDSYLRRAAGAHSAEKVKSAYCDSVFSESNGYHSIVLRGERIPTLTDLQADVIRVLHSAAMNGQSELSYGIVACKIADFHDNELGFAPPEKMSQIFRSGDSRRKLIVSTKPGYYRLNI